MRAAAHPQSRLAPRRPRAIPPFPSWTFQRAPHTLGDDFGVAREQAPVHFLPVAGSCGRPRLQAHGFPELRIFQQRLNMRRDILGIVGISNEPVAPLLDEILRATAVYDDGG